MKKIAWPGAVVALALFACGCAGGPPELPYPAFVQVDDLDDVFMASLPGVRAKQLGGDPMTRRSSNRIDLPPGWSGTSGAAPGRSLELFVLQGSLKIADIKLGRGGYAFLPSGSLGFNLRSADGAQILYFLNDIDPDAVIRSPIIIDAALLDWESIAAPGISIKELRKDPGTGARTWLLRAASGAAIAWQSSSVAREGYLLSGQYQHSECLSGEAQTGIYAPGGYFYRPADTVNGGPESAAITESTWLLRETSAGTTTFAVDCVAAAKR
ncbi:MAG: DUF4437 domain-containing protein [Gammaproteobacteria bacterium]|nr:DUF4437 domain-containing protein [Gammaproteobacteria bacterium]